MNQLDELLEHVSSPTITVSIPREDFLAAQAMAVESGCTVHELVLEALNAYLYEDEDEGDDEGDDDDDDESDEDEETDDA